MDVWVEGSAHPPAQVDGSAPRAPASRPAAASRLSRPAPSSSPAVCCPSSGRQSLAKRSTATGVFGLSPLHSVCVGEMFLVPEGMKGLGLVSMATGRKRLAPLTRNNFGVIQTLEIPAPARSHPRWILQELRIPVTSLLNLSTQCGLSFYPPPIWSSLT